MKGKKGGIGEALTWVVAFLTVFFIMFVFALASFLTAAEPIDFEISETDSILQFVKNDFYEDIWKDPQEIKFVKKLQDEIKS